MALPETLDIDQMEIPRLRVGLKWDASEQDVFKAVNEIKDTETAKKSQSTDALSDFVYWILISILKPLGVAQDFVQNLEQMRKNLGIAKGNVKEFLEQEEVASCDLDLLCFCYDGAGKLAGLITPLAGFQDYPLKSRIAILHSGDETDGLSSGFDEQLLISLREIDAEVQHVYFVVASNEYGFNEIDGGAVAVLNTKRETTMLTRDLEKSATHKTYIFSRLERIEGGWRLHEISEYCDVDADKESPNDDTIDDILRHKYLKLA